MNKFYVNTKLNSAFDFSDFLSLISFVPLCFMFSFLYPIVVGYMGQVPGFKATILPIVLITFYCLYLCLSLVPISHSQSFNFGIQNKTGIQVILVLVITGIFMVVCMKPKPKLLKFQLPEMVRQA